MEVRGKAEGEEGREAEGGKGKEREKGGERIRG